ncbi:uncharacterized protein DNG_04632 [Cephalotrichum gorgonifer]|uniref:Uncharacterized protein n=1 Tax=Cephalotrichum gorgonifer TaxID=2041049 RepID=A0AAE8MYI1_9PEZI|nr:uncharacterized protein DNG_04632 [Cephalotrichum gorgonifer]
MKSQLILTGAVALLPAATHAMNPEDVTGVISNTIVPNPDLCEALCKKNAKCIYSLYHLECDQCWLMDCSGGMFSFGSAIGVTKFTTETAYYCNSTLIPDMPTDCGNVTATATITSLDQAQQTSGSNSDGGSGGGDKGDDGNAAGTREVAWLLAAGAAAAAALVV